MYPCAILADPEGNAWDFASSIYKKLKERSKKFELTEINIKKFGDREFKNKIEKNVRRHICFYIHDSSKNPSEWFTELCLINHTLRNSSAQEIVDVLPYLKFSRQDRKDESRVPISARVVADVIGLYADRVLTIDVHNPAIQGFYNIPFDNLPSFPEAAEYFKKYHKEYLENLVIMAADVGGGGRAKSFARRVGAKDIVIGNKTKNKEGKIIDMQLIGNVGGRNVLIVDDIIDSGGTLCWSYDKLKSRGAKKIAVYAAHGIFSKGIDELVKCFDMLVIGDSIINPEIKHEKIERVSFVNLLEKAIYRTVKGESLSELYN